MTDLPARLRAVSLSWRTEISRLTKMMNEYIATQSAEAAEKSFAKAEVYNRCAADLDALLGALETEPENLSLEPAWTFTEYVGAGKGVVVLTAEQAGQIKALLSAGAVGRAEPPDGWQPIETAPKDGREVVLIGTLWNDPAQRRRACISRWCTTREESPAFALGWYFSAPGYSDRFNPTHWLPAPPVTERRAP